MASETDKILNIAPEELVELPGFNVRLANDPDNIAHIAELAESICHVGVLEPLTVYLRKKGEDQAQDHYVVTNGHCRLEAVKLAIARGAPIKTVPVRLEPKRASAADHTFSMIARNSGKALSQLELGVACKRMIGFGWTEADLAGNSGYSIQHIRNVLALASAPDEVQKMVETGEVSATLATQAVAAEGANAGPILKKAVALAKDEAVKKPAKKGAPVKATLKHVSKVKGQTKQPEPSTMMSDERLASSVRACSKLENGLALFESFGKRKLGVFELLLSGAAGSRGNGSDPALTSLALIFGRVTYDKPDGDGIVAMVMNGDDWEAARSLLKLDVSNKEFAAEHGVKD